MGRLDRPGRETVLVSCVRSCVRGVLLGVLRVPRVLACVRPHPLSIREDRATLEAGSASYGIRALGWHGFDLCFHRNPPNFSCS